MRISALNRYALCNCAVIAMLAGCAGSQLSIRAPSATSQQVAGGVSGAFAQVRPARSAARQTVVIEYVYVVNLDSDNVSTYTIDAITGALTQVKGSPFRAGTSPFNVAVDPKGKFAYVTHADANNVSAYRIDAASGALKRVKGSPFAAAPGLGRGSRSYGQVRICNQLRLFWDLPEPR